MELRVRSAMSDGVMFFVVALLGVLPLGAGDWPHFGYDDQYTSYYPGKTKINAGNVRQLQRKWGLLCDGGSYFASFGSPACYRGTVYAQVVDSPLMALDSCGGVAWQYGNGSFWQHSQPALSQDGIIFYFVNDMTTTTLAAVNRNGKQLWTAPPVFDISSQYSGMSVPTVDEGRKVVYVVENTFRAGEGRLFALSKSTGKVLWYLSKENDGIGFRGPYVVLKNNYLFARGQKGEWYEDEQMVRVNALSRKVEITYDLPGDYYVPEQYSLLGDILLVEYNNWGKGLVAAYKMNSRKILWQNDLWGRSITGSLACNTKLKRVYVPADSMLYALDVRTGKEIWTYGGTSSIRSPSVANGVIYFLSGTYAYALNESTGKELFSYDIGREADESAQVAIGNDTVYAWGSRAECGLVALSLPEGGRCETGWGVYNTTYCTPSGTTTFTGTVAGVGKSSTKTGADNPATWEGYANATPGKLTLRWTLSTTCAGSFKGTWTPSTLFAANKCYCFVATVTSGGEVAVGLYEIVDCGAPSVGRGLPVTGGTPVELKTFPDAGAPRNTLGVRHGESNRPSACSQDPSP